MLRLLVALVLVFVAVWYFVKEERQDKAAVERQMEQIDVAAEAARATEDASAAMAAQADAARDAAMGVQAPADGGEGGGDAP